MPLNHHFSVPILLALSLAAGSTASADLITVGTVKDNTLYQEGGGLLSNGAGQYMFAGQTAASTLRRALIAFDLSSLPGNAIVQDATLTMFMSKTTAGVVPVNLHRLQSDWGESTSDAPDQEGGGASAEIGDATWVHTFFPDSFWNVPGGDFVADPSGTQMVGGVGSYSWTSAGLAADIQGWVDGSFANFGWVLVGDETTLPSSKRFNTRENVSGSPLLTIEFTVIPEPSVLGWFTLIGILAFGRRRTN